MRLWIVSDLHLESLPWVPNRIPDHDVLVVAGDVVPGLADFHQSLSRLRHRTRRPVVGVPGNHEHFGEPLGSFAAWEGGVHILPNGDTVVIDGVRFVGATLWTDFLLNEREYQAQAWAAKNMPDYAHIKRADGELIWPRDVAEEHDRHRAAIEAVLAAPFAGRTVVVTHHAPSAQSLQPGDRLHESAGAFASDLEPLIWMHQPALWVHGHSHSAADYLVGGTRVICNPRGYETLTWVERTGWKEDLVVEV